MKLLNGVDDFPERLRGGVASLGKFDGMHLGHSRILERVREHAVRLGTPSFVLTFDPPPASLLGGNVSPPLCTLERKLELLRNFDLDAIVVVPTTIGFLQQSAASFFRETLVDKLAVKAVVEGENFSFGHGRSGNADALQRFGSEAGIEIDLVESVKLGETIISSSEIRRRLQHGDLKTVNAMLPQPFRLTGTVIDGEHRGRTLGYPTANLGDVQTIVPQPGIYATFAWLDGRRYAAATHLGANPTFGSTTSKIEVYILDFTGDIYGKTLHVDFLEHLRGIVKFESVDMLLHQMEQDVRRVRERT